MEITIKDLYQNIDTLPKSLYKQANDFLEFLKFQNEKEEYEVPEWQKEEVLRRMKYAEEHPESLISEEEIDIFLNELENEI